MSDYFRAIGFNALNAKTAFSDIANDILKNPDSRNIINDGDDLMFFEYYKYYNDTIGLSIKGSCFDIENVAIENLSPLASTKNTIDLSGFEVFDFGDRCIISCEEESTGNEISFYLHNKSDYYNNKRKPRMPKANVVGLASLAKIILPISRDESYSRQKERDEKRYRELVRKARSGDEMAEEKLLTISEKNSRTIKERLKQEDLFSVMDSYFWPVANEAPCYCVLGSILGVSQIRNSYTREMVYIFNLDIEGVKIEVCVNSRDLMGAPSVGMRFMGQCWLQGKLFF